ncbi:MAG: TonB-dependent receptor [Acidobacteria bacterium]|nr:TonB-dependent receptor [Acidobacteriota bacterium]
MRTVPYLCAFLACALLPAQIPSQEDLETKSKRDSIHDGLEMREVRESSAKDVGEALSRLDGLSKLRKGAIANDVVLRGYQSNNINMLIDGVRIYGACPGHMDPPSFHVDFAEVERVEVTKGGFDLTNQGSLGGSVNIVRKRPLPGLHFTPSLQMGSFGYWNPSLTASAGNDKIEFLAGYAFRTSNPFRDGAGRRMTELGGYRPDTTGRDAFSIHTGWTSLRFSPAKGQHADLAYTRQQGSNILYPYLQMDSPYDNADRLSAGYQFRDLGSLRRLALQSYYTRVRHWMTDEWRTSAANGLDVFSMATYAGTRTGGGRADLEFTRGLTLGFESYQRNWDAVNSFRMRALVADQNIVPNVNITVAGAYGNYEKSLTDRIRIAAGARLDTAHSYARSSTANLNLFEAYKATSELSRRDTNPSANARIHIGLNNNLEVTAGAASTVRVPDAQERYFNHRRMGSDWVGNPALNPTRNTETNAGLNYRRGGFFAKALTYYSALGDFIVVHNQRRLQMRPGIMNLMARSFENVDARMYGGEFSTGASFRSRWLVSAGATYTRASKDARPDRAIFDTDLPEISPLRGRAALRYGQRRWFAEAEGIAASSQRRVDGDLYEIPTAGYATANIKGGLHLDRFTLTVGIDNLLDRLYYEHLSFQRDPFRTGLRIPEPGRNLFFNISHRF